MVARTPGEPMCAVGVGGVAYVGIYIQSILLRYDPARPFAFRENPREIGEMFREHHQTRPTAAVTDGERVYVASEGDYNRLGGALAVIDAKTGRVDAYPQPVKDQNVTSLAYNPKHKLVWGGTNRWGQMRSAPPTQESAVVFAFDPQTRRVVATLTPAKGGDHATVLGCTDEGTVVAATGDGILMIDGESRQVTHRGGWPVMPGRIRRGSDGHQYFLADGHLWQWSSAAKTLTPVAVTGGCTMFSEPSPGLWLLADATSVYRVRTGKV
jgi:DNA-binding beta-propeller fold protein YncE